jgi:hypothetical protein
MRVIGGGRILLVHPKAPFYSAKIPVVSIPECDTIKASYCGGIAIMNDFLNKALKVIGEFLAPRKGLPVLVGAGLIVLSLLFNLLPDWPVIGWLADTDLFLHLGAFIGLIGVLLGDAL